MSKKTEKLRSQPELLFVFDSVSKTQPVPQRTMSATDASERKALSPDMVKVHRDKLIEELREFGC